MFETPQAEHQWLNSFVGEWETEINSEDCGDQPATTTRGRLSVRSVGGIWIVAEGHNPDPKGADWMSIMTVGFDAKAGRYVGSFVASMMTFQWIYSGQLDESGRKLILDTEGPKFDQSGMAQYQDMLEKVTDDHWILSSQMLGDDGQWNPFMTCHHRRKS